MRFSAAVIVTFLAVGVESFSTVAPFRAAPSLVSAPKIFSTAKTIRHTSRSTTQLYESAAAAVPAPEESSTGGGTATISNEIFNLVKGIVGAGVLSLPAGMCDHSICQIQ